MSENCITAALRAMGCTATETTTHGPGYVGGMLEMMNARVPQLCDVGGATGLLSSLVARRHAHLKCLSVDLPEVEPIARRWIEKDGMSDRVQMFTRTTQICFVRNPRERRAVPYTTDREVELDAVIA